jgi:TetR/AcrR family transcriptional repressor of mexJK operon
MARKVAAPPAPGSKRERVVRAASKLFLENGYGATGMDAIAQEADVSKATVYSYYRDKASLFADVMVQMCEDVGRRLDAEGLPGGSLEEDLRAIALHGLQHLLAAVDQGIVRRVVAESGEFPELGRKFWETGPGKIQELFARRLEDARRKGRLDVDDPARAARRLVGQLAGPYVMPILAGVRGRPSEAEIRRDVDALVAGFLAAVERRR